MTPQAKEAVRAAKNPVYLANAIGKPAGLFCKYATSRKTQKFTYQFFRYGRFLGEISDPARVVAKMERYKGAK